MATTHAQTGLLLGVVATAVAPVGGPVAVTAAVAGSVLPDADMFAVVLVGVALHAAMDVFGAGLELRPREATSRRAVYDYVRGRWLRPRRWIRSSPAGRANARPLALRRVTARPPRPDGSAPSEPGRAGERRDGSSTRRPL